MPFMKTIVIFTYDLLLNHTCVTCVSCSKSKLKDRIAWRRKLLSKAISSGYISPDYRIEVVDSFSHFVL